MNVCVCACVCVTWRDLRGCRWGVGSCGAYPWGPLHPLSLRTGWSRVSLSGRILYVRKFRLSISARIWIATGANTHTLERALSEGLLTGADSHTHTRTHPHPHIHVHTLHTTQTHTHTRIRAYTPERALSEGLLTGTDTRPGLTPRRREGRRPARARARTHTHNHPLKHMHTLSHHPLKSVCACAYVQACHTCALCLDAAVRLWVLATCAIAGRNESEGRRGATRMRTDKSSLHHARDVV